MVATDHAPFHYKGQKDMGRGDFTRIPNGMPGVEWRVSLLYNFGVRKNRISLNRWVEITSTNAAKLFGLYPQKGEIMPGSDGDLVIFDPARLRDRADFGADATLQSEGVDYLFVNGELVIDDGELTDAKPGRLLRRTNPL